MKANRRRQFTAPRLLKEPKRARQSDSDEDDIPFSELKEKVVSERQGSDSDKDNIPFSQIQTRLKSPLKDKGKGIKRVNDREANETSLFGEPLRWSDDENNKMGNIENPDNMKGVNIARDFGKQGVYYGEVVQVEYDDEDADKV
jgi:hypothetical protein